MIIRPSFLDKTHLLFSIVLSVCVKETANEYSISSLYHSTEMRFHLACAVTSVNMVYTTCMIVVSLLSVSSIVLVHASAYAAAYLDAIF